MDETQSESEIAILIGRKEQVEAARKEVMDDFKDQLNALEKEIRRLARVIRGEEGGGQLDIETRTQG